MIIIKLFIAGLKRGGGGGVATLGSATACTRKRGGGGQENLYGPPSSNIVEFKMGIKNLFSKLKSDFKEKRYDGLKKGA